MAVVPIFVQLFFRAAVGVLGELALPQHSGQVIARETVGETGKVLLRIVTAGGSIQQTADGIVEHIVGEVAVLMVVERLCMARHGLVVRR